MRLKLFIAAIAIPFLISCELSEHEDLNQNVIDRSSIGADLDNIEIIKNPQTLQQMFSADSHQDEIKFNNLLNQVFLATKELVADQNFVNIIIEHAKTSANNSVPLLELQEIAPTYYNIINNNLSTYETSLETIFNNLTYQKDQESTVDQYEPAIFIPNLDKADGSLTTLISCGTPINADINPEFEDYISTEFIDGGLFVETLISEETSLITTNPILIIDNASMEPVFENFNTFPPINIPSADPTDTAEPRDAITFSSNEFLVNERFESSGRSEIQITIWTIESDGDVRWTHMNHNNSERIAKLRANEIGTNQSRWLDFADAIRPLEDNPIFWNFFERDWHRGIKGLGVGVANGSTAQVAGNMRFETDYYGQEPNGDLEAFDSVTADETGSREYDFENGYIRIWAIE